MGVKNSLKNTLPLVDIIRSSPRMLQVSPSTLWFLNCYMSKFQIRRIGGNLVLHSHLPPLNSRAYSRFVKEHLLERTTGPSHAQIGITNACPQHCVYCYNRHRQGQVMDKDTIRKVILDLKEMGVVWLGLTGGEPLLNQDIVEIVESVAGDCAVKLFTTGCTLTREKALALKHAGLFSVSISLDHWDPDKHDRARRSPGAFRQALKAVEIFRSIGGIHVGVSSVLSREMILRDQVEEFLDFLRGLDIHEAWLSEVKPSLESYWDSSLIITEDDRLKLVKLQDRCNAEGKMTVNYLGHFEGKECFGCNAGNKMVYVDAFGEVSPCVFTPLSFGNIRSGSIADIFSEMKEHFPSEDSCFINKNYRLLARFSSGRKVISKPDTLKMLKEVRFGRFSRFNKLYYGQKAESKSNLFGECIPEVGRPL
jgi:MoaA/NifB/PqqE/SkfB family radical SAM enzyme